MGRTNERAKKEKDKMRKRQSRQSKHKADSTRTYMYIVKPTKKQLQSTIENPVASTSRQSDLFASKQPCQPSTFEHFPLDLQKCFSDQAEKKAEKKVEKKTESTNSEISHLPNKRKLKNSQYCRKRYHEDKTYQKQKKEASKQLCQPSTFEHFPLDLQKYFSDQAEKKAEKKIESTNSEISHLPNKRKLKNSQYCRKRYHEDKTYQKQKKEANRKYSKVMYEKDPQFRQKKIDKLKQSYSTNEQFSNTAKTRAKNRYTTDVQFRDTKKTSAKEKYRTDAQFRERTKTSSKLSSKLKYRSDAQFRETKKTSAKTKYATDAHFREQKKYRNRIRYKTNPSYKLAKQTSSVTKYATNPIFRHQLKLYSCMKYQQNDDFRQKVKNASKEKYASNIAFKESKKTASKHKYQRYDSFRNNLKISSLKKYSSDPLFRTKLKNVLKMKYNSNVAIREHKKKTVVLNRKSILKAITTFKQNIEQKPVYVCTVCLRTLYKSQVRTCKRSTYSTDGTLNEISAKCITGQFLHHCEVNSCQSKCPYSKEWICFTCHKYLKSDNMPPQALANGLELPPIPPELQRLNSLEKQLVALRIPFMKVLSLPRGGQKGVKGPCINVPSDLNSVTTTLPRTLNDSQLIKVKLKRKLSYKGHHQYEWINPKHVQDALHYFVQNNKWYKDVTIRNLWYTEDDNDIVLNNDAIEICSSDEEENMDTDASHKKLDVENVTPQLKTTTFCNLQFEDMDIDNPGMDQNENAENIEDLNSKKNRTTEIIEKIDDDLSPYPVETCVQPVDLGQEILDTNGTIFCLAPGENQTPKSIFNEDGIDTMAFPYLLPDGDFGFSMDRPIKLTHSKYFNARLLSADTRFATDNQFLFFAQYVTEITNVSSNMSIALRKGKETTADGKKLNANMLSTSENMKQILKSDIGFRFLQPVRGSPPYWERTMKDLYAIIRQIGIPTFFLTFSAGETRWDEIMNTLLLVNKDNRKLDDLEWTDKCHLIKNNPVMCARLFDHRVKRLFTDLLLSQAQPIGKVKDFFFRTEFQMRGSPHIHCLVWVEHAPRLDENTDAEICRFVDKHISCELPNKDKNPQLYDIVTSVQTHSKQHTKSCKKYSTTCRFNFPKPPVIKTFIARPEKEEIDLDKEKAKPAPTEEELTKMCKAGRSAKQILKDIWTVMSASEALENLTLDSLLKLANTTYEEYKESLETVTTKNIIHHKRGISDCWVNNYNKHLLTAWNANIDIQYVTDVYSCVAYILSYINKSESEMSELLMNAKTEATEGGKNSKETMKKVANVYMNNREVSAQEAAYRVCSLKLKDCSRHVVFIPTGSNSLKMTLPIHVIKSRSPSDENIWMSTIIDKYYARPEQLEFEDMCLADFGSLYTITSMSQKPKASQKLPVYELKNAMGYIKQKQKGKESIIRYPRFNRKKSPEDYYMTLLQLYLPHRHSNLKPDQYVTYEDFVKVGVTPDNRKVLDILNANREKYEKNTEQLEKAWEDLEQGNVHQDAWGQIAPEAEAERLSIEMEKTVRLPEEEEENAPELSLLEDTESNSHYFGHSVELYQPRLSENQMKKSMRELNEQQQQIFYHIRKWCLDVALNKNPEPFFVFLTGGAGTGKTHLVRCIFYEGERILSKSASSPDSTTILLTAPTGTAAFNIGGVTIHSAFAIAKSIRLPYKPLGESILNTLRKKYESLQILVIDEVSMVDHKLLTYIHGRLSQIKHTKSNFGNVSILAVGDFSQLPPVKASPLYKQNSCLYIDLWNPIFKIAVLTKIMRQKDDVEFANVLNRMRSHLKGQPLLETDLTLLSSVSVNETPESARNILHIFPTNKEVKAHNEKMIKTECEKMVFSKAKDFFKSTVTGQLTQREEPYATYASDDLYDVIQIGLGARVMLVRNIDIEDGLVNGAFGTITGIEEKQNGEVQAVFIRFDNPHAGKKTLSKQVTTRTAPENSIRITPFEDSLHGKNVTRKQLPLRLGWAATIHKVQGMTVKNIVVSLKNTFAAGMAYVALSRVSSLKGLNIIDFDPKVIYASEDINKALDSMQPFLDKTVSSESTDTCSLTIAFHNTEGLIPHKEDIKSVKAIAQSDIVCFNETWLKKDATIPSTFLPGFVPCLKSRSESYCTTITPYQTFAIADRGGVGSFIKNTLKFTHKIFSSSNIEYVATVINTPVAFLLINVYRPPVYPLHLFCNNLHKLLLEIDEEQLPVVCVGDFNDNVLQEHSKVLQKFQLFGYSQIVKERTTESGSCLDLVFIKNFETMPDYQVVQTYYSFHDIVQIYSHV